MRVTIVQINLTGNWKPHEYYNIQGFGLANALAQKGCEVTILSSNLILRREDQRVPWNYRCVEDMGTFKVVYLPTLGMVMKQPILPTLPLEIARSKPDVVQTDEDAYLSTLYVVSYCALARLPVVPWQGIYRYVRRKTRLHKLYCKTLGRIAYRGATMWMAKTSSAKRFLLWECGVAENRVHVVPVGTDCSRYTPQDGTELVRRLGLPEGKILLNVGRFDVEKEQGSLIRAMKLIGPRIPNCYLALFGKGPCEESLRSLVKELDLADRVFIITEQVPNDQIRKLYSAAFLYLIPSSYEIFNMTMLESLSCGTPIIARREGGMADVLEDQKAGFLYDGSGEPEICRAVCSLADDPVRYRAMKTAASERAWDYDWSNVADKFLVAYQSAMSQQADRTRQRL